jgi:hypothetical protein
VRLPAVVAHADWGTAPGKRQVAVARLAAGVEPVAGDLAGGVAGDAAEYVVTSLARAPDGDSPASDLLHGLAAAAFPGLAVAGFDFAIGLPRGYARAARITSFPEFLDVLGSPPWEEFGHVAAQAGEIALGRPFYPATSGGTRRDHLYQGLGLTARDLRRRCEGNDAETLFWTLGSKQVGKAALTGWQLLAAGRRWRCGRSPARCLRCSTAAAASLPPRPTRASTTATPGPALAPGQVPDQLDVVARDGASGGAMTGWRWFPASWAGQSRSG